MPPIPPSPIQEFRNWLKMADSEREKIIAQYPQEKQTVLRQKIQAYAAMPTEQRERRLQMLELRWYLRPLMGVPPEERGDYRNMIPPRLHELVSSRLQQWDRLDASTRRDILANDDAREMATRYFIHLRKNPAQGLNATNPALTAELREKLQHWSSTTPAQREKMAEQLSAFFQLPPSDQERALQTFSEQDREEMQKALEAFARLPLATRRVCVQSFQKFANMSSAERGEFLRKAERWQQMTAQERETWKNLVTKLPPMPPAPIELPPVPRVSLEGRTMATGASGPPPILR